MAQHLLIHKSLSGEISDKEKEKLDSWLAHSPENRKLFEEIKLIWDNADFGEMELDYDPEEELRAIQDRIRRGEQKSGHTKSKRPLALKVAAVALLLIASNFLVWSLTRPADRGIVQVTNGQHYNEIVLPDSSRVYLNKNTTFSFKQASGKRQAYLKGEAYFEVAEDQNRPFFVHLQNATVKVLGTSFNVKAYPDKDSTEVVVASGTVEFYNGSQSVKLGPGEKGRLHRLGQGILKTINKNPNFDAWRTGKLQFKNVALGNVLVILEDHYNTSFKVKDDKLLTCRFTGTFKNEKFEKVLKVLSFGLNIEFKYRDGQYLISGEGCHKK